jgi:D-inositol-3-phosphate glycosyltransferase
MHIRLLSSHSRASLLHAQNSTGEPRHPTHLPDDLSCALREQGHQVEVELLGDAVAGQQLSSLREGASAGPSLAARLTNVRVLHALDAVSWAAALTARSRADVAVVLRYGESGERATGRTEATERRAYHACLRAADAIAATADGDRQAAVRAGVRGERALLVPDLVGILEEQSSLAVLCPGRLLVSLGGIGPGSGIETVLTALRWLPTRELVIAGAGHEADWVLLHGRLRRLGLEHRVRWLGWLDRADAIRLMDSAALVICSGPSDGATTAIEAMARSRPVAAVAGGRAADVVVDGVTGAVLPADNPSLLGQTLRAVLKNPFLLEAMGLAGRERALAMFGPDRAVRATEQAYRIALGAA